MGIREDLLTPGNKLLLARRKGAVEGEKEFEEAGRQFTGRVEVRRGGIDRSQACGKQGGIRGGGKFRRGH